VSILNSLSVTDGNDAAREMYQRLGNQLSGEPVVRIYSSLVRNVMTRSDSGGVRRAVVHMLNSDTAEVQCLRNEYDPTARLIQPHVTLVFPFEVDRVAKPDLLEHVAHVAQQAAPFDARFSRLELSWDQWVFLTPDLGVQQLVSLHDQLYAGLLHPFHRVDLPFVPHVSIGYFGSKTGGPDLAGPVVTDLDRNRYDRLMSHVDGIKLECSSRVTEIQLIMVDPDFTGTHLVRSFPLGS
jgi:2'-5' RNA ligase